MRFLAVTETVQVRIQAGETGVVLYLSSVNREGKSNRPGPVPQMRKINYGVQQLGISKWRVRTAPNALRNEAGQVFTAVRFFKQEVTIRSGISPLPGFSVG
jgi:hypothetical protein